MFRQLLLTVFWAGWLPLAVDAWSYITPEGDLSIVFPLQVDTVNGKSAVYFSRKKIKKWSIHTDDTDAALKIMDVR